MTEAERAETLRKAAFADRAREVMSKYQSIIRALGAETEFPAEVNASGFLEWLKLELELLEGHLQHGRDFAASVSFRTLNVALVEAKCEHLFGLNLSDVDHFWRVPAEANSIGLRLYEEFWLQGGSDVALMKAACSRARVISLRSLRFCLRLFLFSPIFAFLLCCWAGLRGEGQD